MRNLVSWIVRHRSANGFVAILTLLSVFLSLRNAIASDLTFNSAYPSNPYRLAGLDGFSLGDYNHCKWGVWQDSTSDTSATLKFDWLTNGQSNSELESELLLCRGLTESSQFLPFSSLTSRSWTAPYGRGDGQLTLTQGGGDLHLLRRLHFRDNLENASWGSAIPDHVKKFIILIHGWNPDAKIWHYGSGNEPFSRLYNGIESSLIEAKETSGDHGWEVCRYHWEEDAATGGAIDLNFNGNGRVNPTEAASIGYCHGLHLGEMIRNNESIEKVHFIVHSAGTWVAYGAVQTLLAHNSPIRVQLTLLDPFVPGALTEDDPNLTNSTPLKKSLIDDIPTTGPDPYSPFFFAENIYAIDDIIDPWAGSGSDWSAAQIFFCKMPQGFGLKQVSVVVVFC